MSRARLALQVDVAGLRADVEQFDAGEWVPHFNTGGYEGDWSGVALRSVGGVSGRLYPDPAAVTTFTDTPLLLRCPSVRRVLDALDCPKLSVRFLRLGPGSRIREHTDLDLGYDDGEVRLHVPVSTSPEVEFLHDGAAVDMAQGEVWYLDLNLVHAVHNRGMTPRIHLVVDCSVSPWLTGQLRSGG